jgi:translation initiation factor 3 subunit L
MASSSDDCVPTVFTDFIFDLYDSVTLSQIPEEQAKLYTIQLKDLSKSYFDSSPWPSAQLIASECNGDPLFLAVYRELTHRHWHAVSRPTIRDRMEGWNVYRELFDEILDRPHFYLLPAWVFDILQEFVYQFQGFCQIRTVVYSAARKYGVIKPDGTVNAEHKISSEKQINLAENLSILQSNNDAWDVEAVFSYLNKFIQMGLPTRNTQQQQQVQPVYSYFGIFSSIVMARLECLMGDYTASLHALQPIHLHQDYVIADIQSETKDDAPVTTTTMTVADVL